MRESYRALDASHKRRTGQHREEQRMETGGSADRRKIVYTEGARTKTGEPSGEKRWFIKGGNRKRESARN